MSKVSAKDVAPGMRLARPVINKDGLVMIGEDTELTDSLVDKIRRMDVDSIYVLHGVFQKPDRLAARCLRTLIGGSKGLRPSLSWRFSTMRFQCT
jgi:hypothetical protein